MHLQVTWDVHLPLQPRGQKASVQLYSVQKDILKNDLGCGFKLASKPYEKFTELIPSYYGPLKIPKYFYVKGRDLKVSGAREMD